MALEWAERSVFVSHGVRFGLRSEQAGLLVPLDGILPPDTHPDDSARVHSMFSIVRSPGEAGALELYRGEEPVCSERDPHRMRRRLASQIRLHVAIHSRRRVFIHAGAVALGGKGVLLPGASFHGKSTLVAELVRAGASYYSDDYAALDGQGRLHPFAKPISLRADGSTLGVDHPVSDFGGEEGRHPVAVGAILVTRYEPGAVWRPIAGTSGDGALALMRSAVGAHRRPHAALAAVERAATGSRILIGTRGEARQMVGALISLLTCSNDRETERSWL